MAGPPWIDPQRQHEVTWRDGDVIISAPAKCGTNWMMNVVHQLLTGGTDEFESIYDVVPWPEFIEQPGQPMSEVTARLDAMPTDQRRAFKSHAGPPRLPYLAPEQGHDVKYVVVLRNPEEALVSFKTFLDKHTDAFLGLWGVPRAALCRPDVSSFFHEVVLEKDMVGLWYGFLASWWPHRNADNVLLMHFADMKQDLPGSVRRVAEFLAIEPDAAQWPVIDEHTTFAWMKANDHKFETMSRVPVPVLERGAMIRRGELGKARDDGMTPEIAARMREVGTAIVQDEAALEWLYAGGAIA